MPDAERSAALRHLLRERLQPLLQREPRETDSGDVRGRCVRGSRPARYGVGRARRRVLTAGAGGVVYASRRRLARPSDRSAKLRPRRAVCGRDVASGCL
jgi:hypothetical protein